MKTRPRGWLCFAAAAIVLIAFFPFFTALVRVSMAHPYAGHVVLVPILGAVLLWIERRRLGRLSAAGGVAGIGLTGLALVVLAIAYSTANVPLQAVSFVVAVAGLGYWFYGFRGLRSGSFVLVFLLFMVPPPQGAVSAIAPGIQHFVAVFSTVVLDVLRIPVERQGILLVLPGLMLEVAEECAGLRFLLILFVFVTAFARVVLPTISGQLALMALSVPVAVLANAIRVAVTSAGAYAMGPYVVTGPLHYYIGKAFWALALVAMIGIAWRVRSWTGGAVADGPRPRRAWVEGAP